MFSVIPSEIKRADELASKKYGIPEITLMKNAAASTCEIIKPHLCGKNSIVILCGKGNNAGDGYEISNLLSKDGKDVCVVNIFGVSPSSMEAKTCFENYIADGGKILSCENAYNAIANADVIIDAIFGIGFSGDIEKTSDCGKIINAANSADALKIAVDTPSGINTGDGRVSSCPFKADLTVTMAILKTGMLSYPARQYCGKISVADIGYPNSLFEELQYDALIPDNSYIEKVIPERKQNTNKCDFGKLLMFCGSQYMTGAPYLACLGALRTGVGLVKIVRDEKTLSILQSRISEPVFIPSDTGTSEGIREILKQCDSSSAVLIGCGLGKAQNDVKCVREIIKNTKSKLIIDADGINALSGDINVLKEAKTVPILTPHPLEFSRLCGLGVEQIQADRIRCAKDFAKEYRCILVLKGASTVICSPDGRLAVNTTGNAGLSKGGSGDVLAGVCASFVCQGIDGFDSAASAVYLHGKTADILKEEISEYGFLPSELPFAIAKLLP